MWAAELIPDRRRFPHVTGGPGGGWLDALLRFRPSWLPTAYGESTLGAVVVGDTTTVVSRTWTDPASTTNSVSLTIGWSDVYAGSQTPGHTAGVEVHGVPGTLTEHPDGSADLRWQPAGEPKLTVSVGNWHGREVALRVARSLVSDDTSLSIGPRLGWLPADLATAPWMLSVTYDNTAWTQSS